MKRVATIGSMGLALGLMGLAAPAVASAADCTSGCPVSADVSVGTTLTVTGISNAIHFGNGTPGTTSDAPGAEQFHVLSNLPSTVSIKPSNGGFHSAVGQPDRIDDNAVTIDTNTSGTVRLAPASQAQSSLLETLAPADNAISESWHLDIPATVPPGALNAQFLYIVVSST